MTSSKTFLITSNSPGPPDRQLLTANLTALCPLHFVPVTYIFLVALMAAVNFAPQSGSDGGKADSGDPRNKTMFMGTIAAGSRARISSEDGLRSS
jgi:hypothetical protein